MKPVLLKAKKNDCKSIYYIRNEKSIRYNSKNKDIINFRDHKKWFYNNYKIKNNYFFICKLNKSLVGYVRYTKKSFYFIVSIAIKKNYRNLGLASFLIQKSEKLLSNSKLIISEVRNTNKKSIKMFLNNGYINIGKNKKFYIFGKIVLKDNFSKSKRIIDKIKQVRSKNNVNWMNILEIAFKNFPKEAATIFNNINKSDNKILNFSKKLSKI